MRAPHLPGTRSLGAGLFHRRPGDADRSGGVAEPIEDGNRDAVDADHHFLVKWFSSSPIVERRLSVLANQLPVASVFSSASLFM